MVQYTRLREKIPFGITNAQASFQRFMERCLGNLPDQECVLKITREKRGACSTSPSLITKVRSELKLKRCKLFRKEVSFLQRVILKTTSIRKQLRQ